MNKKLWTFGLLFLVFLSFPLFAQWIRTYGGRRENDARCIRATYDGGYIMAGFSNSFPRPYEVSTLWISKLDLTGEIQWQQAIEVSNPDRGFAVRQTKDEGYIAACSTGASSGETNDILVVKLSSSGASEWSKPYGGSQNESVSAIQQTLDGGYIIASSTESFGAGKSDIWVLKIDAQGKIVWQKTYGGELDDAASAVLQTQDGGYIVGGSCGSSGCVLKLAGGGKIEWARACGGQEIRSVEEIPSVGYIAAGATRGGAGKTDLYVVKLGTHGEIKWQRVYGGTKDDSANSVQPTRGGGSIVAGVTESFGAGGKDFWVLRLGSDGSRIWEETCGGVNAEEAYSVLQSADGDFIVGGTTESFGFGTKNALILKLTSSGGTDPLCSLSKPSKSTSTDYTDQEPDPKVMTKDSTATITSQPYYFSWQQTYGPAYNVCSGKFILSILSESGGTTQPGPGDYLYDAGTKVTIRAIPSGKNTFSHWAGDASGMGNPVTLKMDGHKLIQAFFSETYDWGNGSQKQKSSWCFIATAAYGSSAHSHVKVLREFRDRYLLTSGFGRSLTKVYYRISPSLARIIARHRFLRAAARLSLLPFVAVFYSALHFGAVLTFIGLAVLFALPPFSIHLIKKKLRKRR
jgi:hypothetical protein